MADVEILSSNAHVTCSVHSYVGIYMNMYVPHGHAKRETDILLPIPDYISLPDDALIDIRTIKLTVSYRAPRAHDPQPS